MRTTTMGTTQAATAGAQGVAGRRGPWDIRGRRRNSEQNEKAAGGFSQGGACFGALLEPEARHVDVSTRQRFTAAQIEAIARGLV